MPPQLAIKNFHIYLAPKIFTVRTDNKAVRDFFINKKPIEQGKRLAWYNKISKYTFEVEHYEGTNNFFADFLVGIVSEN